MTEIIIVITVIVFGVSFYVGGVFKRKSKKKPDYIFKDGTAFLDLEESDIVRLTNLYRNAEELNSLKVDLELNISAENRVKAMIFDGKLSHRGFFKICNYLKLLGFEAISENVGFGYNTPEAVVNGWFKSDSHRKNIEGNWRYTGVSIFIDSKTRRKYYCQMFAR